MISRRRRTEVLVESDRAVALGLAALVCSEVEATDLARPRQGLVMQCLYFDQVPTAGDLRVAAFDGGAANCFGLSRQQQRHIRDTIFGMPRPTSTGLLRRHGSSASS